MGTSARSGDGLGPEISCLRPEELSRLLASEPERLRSQRILSSGKALEKKGLLAFIILVVAVFAFFTLLAAGGISFPASLGFVMVFVTAFVLWSLWTFWGKKPLNPDDRTRTDPTALADDLMIRDKVERHGPRFLETGGNQSGFLMVNLFSSQRN